ncbi:MAG: hypothetical protein AAFX06_03325 [Planctomycetota bacterium]
MFGSKQRKKPAELDWARLLALLESEGDDAAVERLFPVARNESYLDALRRLNAKHAAEAVALGRQVEAGARLAQYPTLAIAGMLNGGKTSLVASMLSERGRARTLRGVANRHGTHRFVLWLPSRWREEPSLWELLLEDFGNAVGHAPELLAEDPDEAHEQYNNRTGGEDALGVPLVATDPALDELRVGLLDCPDIVSDEVFGVGSPEQRRDLLGKAATFCSAFLIVSTPSMARDRTLGEILHTVSDLMPGVPRYLAVNKIREGQLEDVLESFEPQTSKYDVKQVYGAYDFEIPGCRALIPSTNNEPAADEKPLPVFFEIDPDSQKNIAGAIADERLLTQLPAELERPESSDRFLLGRQAALRRALLDRGMESIEKGAEESDRLATRARKTMLDTTVSLFTKTDASGKISDVRMHQSERIIRQMADAFCEAAPWYAKWGVRINNFIQKRARAASDLLKQYTPTAVTERYAESIKKKFTSRKVGHLVDPNELDLALRRFGAALTLPHWFGGDTEPENEPAWNQRLEETLRLFDANDRVQLDEEQLEKVAEEMWAQIPSHKKLAYGLTPLAAMLATFGSVLMIPFDFGSTLVVANASIVELLAAAGLTAFSAYWAGGKSAQTLSTQAAVEQMSLFYGILCRQVGVDPGEPLPTVQMKQSSFSFPRPKNLSDSVSEDGQPVLGVYRVRKGFRKEMSKLLNDGG